MDKLFFEFAYEHKCLCFRIIGSIYKYKLEIQAVAP